MALMILAVFAVLLILPMTGRTAPVPAEQPTPFEDLEPFRVILIVPESEKTDEPLHHRSNRMMRSVMDQETPEEPEDDLETAAGTNLLRPLFVYRQQMAYRERIKKTGRRAIPNW